MTLLLDGTEKEDVIQELREKVIELGDDYQKRPFYNRILIALDELEQSWHRIPDGTKERWIGFIEGIILCRGAYKESDQIPSVELSLPEDA